MKKEYLTYRIWFGYHNSTMWLRSSFTLSARTDKEAQSKTKRRFNNAGFTNMSIVAVKDGEDPNE